MVAVGSRGSPRRLKWPVLPFVCWDGRVFGSGFRLRSGIVRPFPGGSRFPARYGAATIRPGSLNRWLDDYGRAKIQEHFFLDVVLSTSLDRYCCGQPAASGDISRMFLTIEPESAGYVVLGPTLRLLEAAHRRLPATFLNLFLGSLNRWIRVYDYRDALDRLERLREWYEDDPESDQIELPNIEASIPECVRRKPLSPRGLARVMNTLKDDRAQQLMEQAVELACRNTRSPERLRRACSGFGRGIRGARHHRGLLRRRITRNARSHPRTKLSPSVRWHTFKQHRKLILKHQCILSNTRSRHKHHGDARIMASSLTSGTD